jgi:hypothetical protein
MNFKKVLTEKKLTVENLPKRLQKKISELEAVADQVEVMKATATDPTEIEELTIAKLKVDALDRELEKALKKFDLSVYLARKERMAKINDEKWNSERETESEEESEPKEEPKAQPETEEVFEEEEIVAPEQFELEKEPAISKTQQIKADIDRLQESVKIKPEHFEAPKREEVIEVEPEIEEFEKADNAQPKKMSKGLILMGVGAFLLTWGAVNFFRERRG